MRQRLAAVFLISFVALIVGVVLLARSEAAAGVLCTWLEETGSDRLGGELVIGRCEVDPLRMEVRFFDPALTVPTRGLDASASLVRLRLREMQGLASPLRIQSLELVRPRVRWTGGSSAPKPVACEWPTLPVEILEASIREGSATLALGGETLRLEALEGTLRRRGDRQALSVTVGEAEVTSPAGVRHQGRGEARLAIDTLHETLSVEMLSLRTGAVDVGARGEVAWGCTPQIDGTVALQGPAAAISELAGLDELGLEGGARLSARLQGPVDHPAIAGTLSLAGGAWRRFDLGNLKARWTLADRSLVLDAIETDAIGGRLSAQGRVELVASAPASFWIEAREARVEGLIAALGLPGSWVGGGLGGTLSLEGSLHPLKLDGTADLEVEDFEVLDRAVEQGSSHPDERVIRLRSGRVGGVLALRPEHIEVTQAEVGVGRSSVRFKGRFPFSTTRPMSVSLTAAPVHLDDVGLISGFAFGGQVEGPATLSGRYGDPHVVADLAARGFRFDGLEAGVAMARLDYQGFTLRLTNAHGQRGHTLYDLTRFELGLRPKPVRLDLAVETEGGRVEDVVAAMENFHPLAARFSGAQGSLQGGLQLSGTPARLSAEVDVTASDGVLAGQAFERLQVKGALRERHLWEVDEIQAWLPKGGRLTVRGFADTEGALGLSVAAREVPLEAALQGRAPGLEGRLSGDMVFEGSWEQPLGQGALFLAGGRFRGVPLPASRLRVALAGPAVSLTGDWVGDLATGKGRLDLDSRAFSLDLVLREPELARWRPLLPQRLEAVSGRLDASLTLAGTLGEAQGLEGRLSLDGLQVALAPLRFELRAPSVFVLEDGEVVSDGVFFDAPGDGELALMGRVGIADGALRVTVRSRLALEPLARRFRRVTHAAGTGHLYATLVGTLDEPRLVGAAELDGGALSVAGGPLSLSGMNGRLAFSHNRVVIERLAGSAGGGRVRFGGEMGLAGLSPDTLRLVAELDEVRGVRGGFAATVSGELWLDGPFGDPLLTGDLEVIRGRYRRDFELDELLPAVRRKQQEIAVARDPYARLDVGVHIPGTLRLEGRGLAARLRGDLRVLGTDAQPGLLGALSVMGARAELRGNEWDVSHAVVDFKDPAQVAPSFDLHAESDIRDYRVYVHAYGTPSEPRITLASEPELPETDVLTLVTLGVTTRDAEGLGGGDAAAAAADALFAISGLDRRVRAFIPANAILRDPSLRLTSGYSRYTGQVEPRLAFESRVFVDELRLRYSAPLAVPGQRTQAEYRVTDTVSLQAEWDTEDPEGQLGNLGLDLKLRWEGE